MLERTVGELTGLLLSKSLNSLTIQQKTMLQVLFGDSSILHTLQHKFSVSEKANE
jgi:hypothetical protein